MRVLHFASWHPNRVHPQLGNFVRRHIEALPEEVESTIVHAWPDPASSVRSREVEEVADEVSGIRTMTAYVPDRAPRRWRLERAYARLIERLDREGYHPDVVHLHNAAESAHAAVDAAEHWGVPLVVSENWTAYHAEHGRAFRPKEERGVRRALKAASVHLPVSEHLAQAMAAFAPDVKQVVVPNVVIGPFEPPVGPRSGDGPLRLLHVSSLIDAHKDITGMIHAAAMAAEEGIDFTLDCWGGAGAGGNAVQGYRGLTHQLGVENRITFLGPADPNQVVQAMQEADAFVLFSRYENLPCVLLEAWMTGLPTLATDVGGVGEHLGRHPELGTLLQAGDREGLAEAIGHAAKRKRAGQDWPSPGIAEYARERFSAAAVGSSIEEVYRSVLG